MVKLKEGKLRWALKQKDQKNKHLALVCGIRIRRFQQLKAHYKETGDIPMLDPKRRPKRILTEEEKRLINKAVEESKLTGAVMIRLFIKRYYKKNIPHNHIHTYLLMKGISREDEKKKKQRKYCRYERKHSFSLGHMDWHDSKVIPGKHVIAWEDDASRLVLAGGEFDRETTENAIKIVREAKMVAWERYSALLLQLNTDKGTQFYANVHDKRGKRGKSKFEEFLEGEGIHHIPSRRNHPQTNGKKERWFRTYEEKRSLFSTFDEFVSWYNNRIHLGLSRKEGITPMDSVLNKLRPESLIGLFFRRIE
jgi:putative transposase